MSQQPEAPHMKTKTGVLVEVLPLQNKDKKGNWLTNHHPYVKSKIFEAAQVQNVYSAPFSIEHSDFHPIGTEGRGLWKIELRLYGRTNEQDRILRGSASCSCLPDLQEKRYWDQKQGEWKTYIVDVNDDWAEKAETKAVGRALAFAGFGNVQGSSIASAEDILAFQRRQNDGATDVTMILGEQPDITRNNTDSNAEDQKAIQTANKVLNQHRQSEADQPSAEAEAKPAKPLTKKQKAEAEKEAKAKRERDLFAAYTENYTEEELAEVSNDAQLMPKIIQAYECRRLVQLLLRDAPDQEVVKAELTTLYDQLLEGQQIPRKALELVGINIQQLDVLRKAIDDLRIRLTAPPAETQAS